MATEHQTQEIKAQIDKWTAGMSAVDTKRLKSLWDQSDPNVIYLAEENKEALVGWASIDRYYDNLAATLSNADFRYSDLVVDVFGDVAYAFCYTIGLADAVPEGSRYEFNSRVTFILHRTGGEWKIVHYHESANPEVGPDGRVV